MIPLLLLITAPSIEVIRIEGSGSEALAGIESKIGPLDREAVRRDIGRIHHTGRFEDVRAELDGRSLVFVVVEKPLLDRLEIEGNDLLSDQEVRDAIGLPHGAPYDEPAMAKGLARLRDAYLAIDCRRVKLNHRSTRRGRHADVVVTVAEGPQVRVSSVRFTGNSAISSEDLIATLATRPRSFLGLFDSGHFDEAQLQYDLLLISSAYFDRGYINVNVLEPKVVEIGDQIEIEMTIQEGEQYRIGRVSVRSDRGLPPLKSQQGQIFNRSRLQEDRQALERHFGKEAQIFPQTDIDNERRIVHITFEVTASRGDD